jgi:glutamine phosphoribosylpyrophosphate amidotransferase
MCGIVGMVGLNGARVDPTVLQRMNELQAHRGPDGAGFVLACAEPGGFRQTFVPQMAQWPSQAVACVGLGHATRAKLGPGRVLREHAGDAVVAERRRPAPDRLPVDRCATDPGG